MSFRVDWDDSKDEWLRKMRGMGFVEVLGMFERPYLQQVKNDDPWQFKVIGVVKERLVTLIFETRTDEDGEYEWLITFWPATRLERNAYEKGK